MPAVADLHAGRRAHHAAGDPRLHGVRLLDVPRQGARRRGISLSLQARAEAKALPSSALHRDRPRFRRCARAAASPSTDTELGGRMFGWRKRNDGFEWREYVRTTILVRRRNRRERVGEAAQGRGAEPEGRGPARRCRRRGRRQGARPRRRRRRAEGRRLRRRRHCARADSKLRARACPCSAPALKSSPVTLRTRLLPARCSRLALLKAASPGCGTVLRAAARSRMAPARPAARRSCASRASACRSPSPARVALLGGGRAHPLGARRQRRRHRAADRRC